MSWKFGTDGVRGVANRVLTPEVALQIGMAAGEWLQGQDLPKRIVIGRDTRQSGPMLGAAMAAGFNSVGVDVVTLGVVPTGCVSYVARHFEFGLGAVISASHNPAPDNGIKLMTSEGTKVPTDLERFIESFLPSPERPIGGDVGFLSPGGEEVDAYMAWLATLVPEGLDGMTLVIDAAHGAASELGIKVFQRLGATVIATGDQPDGVNINAEGGATKPETVQALTKAHGADLGVAYDGDADRAVFSDSEGNLINGDRTMAMWCEYWGWQGKLAPKIVVGTVMSNGGFEAYMAGQGIELVRAQVGDKYVSQKLAEHGAKIGGEQSGHIIFPEHGPTGDGLVTALQVARVLKLSGKSATGFFHEFENWPQVLVNVELAHKDGWQDSTSVKAALAQAEANLVGNGRLNVRASGTQPIVRVMVESSDLAVRDAEADRIVGALLDQCGGTVYSRVDLTHALGD